MAYGFQLQNSNGYYQVSGINSKPFVKVTSGTVTCSTSNAGAYYGTVSLSGRQWKDCLLWVRPAYGELASSDSVHIWLKDHPPGPTATSVQVHSHRSGLAVNYVVTSSFAGGGDEGDYGLRLYDTNGSTVTFGTGQPFIKPRNISIAESWRSSGLKTLITSLESDSISWGAIGNSTTYNATVPYVLADNLFYTGYIDNGTTWNETVVGDGWAGPVAEFWCSTTPSSGLGIYHHWMYQLVGIFGYDVAMLYGDRAFASAKLGV